MVIFANGKEITLAEGETVESLLPKLNYPANSAVWINDVQLWYRDYPQRVLKDNDKVQIIRPIGGG